MSAPSPANNLPKAYQDGFQDFYGRDFLVTRDTLIPRPETEQIIDAVLSLAGISALPGVTPPRATIRPDPVIVDVGTGSGCIAITLKKYLPEADIYATDISEPALEIAQKNATKHGTPITFIISHLLQNVKSALPRTPDIIVANLPYVDPDWDWLDKPSLSYEPSTALYAKDHGLALIRELIMEAAKIKVPYLILESDPCEQTDIAAYAKQHRYDISKIRGYITLLEYKN